MKAKCFKKVDSSLLQYGFTIPNDMVKDFTFNKSMNPGSSRDINIVWGKDSYVAKICRKKAVHQVIWIGNKDFLARLRKTFIQSYIILKSKKELFNQDNEKKTRFRTRLEGGQQEVLMIEPISVRRIRVKVYIKITNEWNKLFERLCDENVFGWLFEKSREQYLIQHSSGWIKTSEFREHMAHTNVIYYLCNTKKKLLYIGKTSKSLGGSLGRVTPGKKHQKMPGDWNCFKYDIVRPEFAGILERIEDHTIRAFASILKNSKQYPTLNIGEYKLVNRNWKKL